MVRYVLGLRYAMCIYLPGIACSLEKCLSKLYYRGVELSDCSGDSSVLKSPAF